MRRYFAAQVGSPPQLPPQHEGLEVAEATVPRAATRMNSSANRVFFMIFSSELPLRCFSDFLRRMK